MLGTLAPRHRKRSAALIGLVSLGIFAVPAPAAPPASDTVLVKISGQAGPADRAEIADALQADGSHGLPGGWRVYDLPSPTTAAEARADLADTDAAVRVEMPTRVQPLGAVPSDPLFPAVSGGYQWGLRNTASWNGGLAGADISALEGWDRVSSPAPVTVAVIDTGVQVTHPDLAGRIWTNPDEIPGNGLDDDGNGKVDDVQGWDFDGGDATVYDDAAADRHGTHVAGVIAARRGNGTGIAGIADNARVMPLKFIGSTGNGWNYDAISAIQYAVAKGARVINASFGGTTYDAALCDAISWAASQGVLVVVAAGNNGQNLDGYGAWPAKCPEPTMITVGAFSHTGQMAAFSNRSATQVDVAAPGEWIVSTVPGGYGYMSGTSMATPHVAGVAAAVLGQGPLLTPAQTRQAILDGARSTAQLAGLVADGKRLDLAGALAGTPKVTSGDDTPPAPFAAVSPADGAAVGDRRPVFTWTASSDAGSGLAEYRVRVDGSVVAQGVSATSAAAGSDIAPGPHTWSVEAVDRAGNVTRTDARRLVVDLSPPASFALLEPAAGAKLTVGKYVIRWTASSDTGAGLARYEVLVDGRATAQAPPSADRVRTGLPAGRHTIAVRAVDLAGNGTATPGRAVTVAPVRSGATNTGGAPRVAPTAARVGAGVVIHVRSTGAARARLDIRTGSGARLGGLRVLLRPGDNRLALPTALASRLRAGNYVVQLRADARPAANGSLRMSG